MRVGALATAGGFPGIGKYDPAMIRERAISEVGPSFIAVARDQLAFGSGLIRL